MDHENRPAILLSPSSPTATSSTHWAHNNTAQIIPPNATAEKESAQGGPVRFKPGNIVFSYRSVDVIGVIDRETGHIVWAWGPGELDGQHKPHVLPNGNTLICEGGKSHLFEVTPEGEIAWDYTSPFKEEGAMATYRCLRYAPEYVEPLLRRIWK